MRLSAENLAAKRGDDLLFDKISFSLAAGEALIVTGPNGSGKSTLLRVIAGLLTPESGIVTFTDKTGEPNRRVGEVSHYLGHLNAMKNELTVAENLSFWRSFYGDAPGRRCLEVGDAAEAVGLGGITHLPFGYLSAGQKRRMAFAKLLVAYRPVWILDEPTAALDAGADRTFAELISAHQHDGGIVLAATHQPLELRYTRSLAMSAVDPGYHETWL